MEAKFSICCTGLHPPDRQIKLKIKLAVYALIDARWFSVLTGRQSIATIIRTGMMKIYGTRRAGQANRRDDPNQNLSSFEQKTPYVKNKKRFLFFRKMSKKDFFSR